MPCDPSFLANIKMFELLDEDDRIALAKVVDEMNVPAGQPLLAVKVSRRYRLLVAGTVTVTLLARAGSKV